MKSLERKAERLRESVRSLESAAVAFSGGVDSTLVAKIASDELGPKAVAVTIDSPLFPSCELKCAKRVAREIGIRHLVVKVNPLSDKRFAQNPVDRCYICKLENLERVRKIADGRGLREVVDGTNADDGCDYRPGAKAKNDLGVRSPLEEAGFTKADVRRLSERLKLPTASKSASACLASRIPYGDALTAEKLQMIERAEDFLRGRGFKGARVRMHGPVARLEVHRKDIKRLASESTRNSVAKKLRSLGFTYVTVDMMGYRTGSMDEVLRL